MPSTKDLVSPVMGFPQRPPLLSPPLGLCSPCRAQRFVSASSWWTWHLYSPGLAGLGWGLGSPFESMDQASIPAGKPGASRRGLNNKTRWERGPSWPGPSSGISEWQMESVQELGSLEYQLKSTVIREKSHSSCLTEPGFFPDPSGKWTLKGG